VCCGRSAVSCVKGDVVVLWDAGEDSEDDAIATTMAFLAMPLLSEW